VGTALALAACAAPRPTPTPRPEAPRWVAEDTVPEPVGRAWPVMGTMLAISVWDADTTRALAAMTAARAAVFRVDTLMSVYKPRSELSAVNRRAGSDSATTASAWTAEVLDSALAIAAASGGGLDVTVGPLVDAWGFYRHQGAIPPRAVRDSIAPLVGWRQVRFDRASHRVTLPRRGMRLDFGGIAKGFALDRGIEALRAAGVTRAVVDLGGNFRVLGPPPVAPAGWMMGLKDPRDPDAVFASVRIDSGAIGTSGDYEQFFEANGVRYSHIFDPRTREPARGVVSVSVIAPSGILSDALSKPFYIAGPEEGCRLAARWPGVDVVWVRDSGEREEKEDDDEGLDPELVVITDGLKERLEILTEEPTDERPTTCSELLARAPHPSPLSQSHRSRTAVRRQACHPEGAAHPRVPHPSLAPDAVSEISLCILSVLN
ncbi:MAG TPA: FAD:protein FMN transferase, partial [Longimicrobiaceae bacterium]